MLSLIRKWKACPDHQLIKMRRKKNTMIFKCLNVVGRMCVCVRVTWGRIQFFFLNAQTCTEANISTSPVSSLENLWKKKRIFARLWAGGGSEYNFLYCVNVRTYVWIRKMFILWKKKTMLLILCSLIPLSRLCSM